MRDLELCQTCASCCRHERLKGTPSDVAPILWQNGALARLKKGETIDKPPVMADIPQFHLAMQVCMRCAYDT